MSILAQRRSLVFHCFSHGTVGSVGAGTGFFCVLVYFTADIPLRD